MTRPPALIAANVRELELQLASHPTIPNITILQEKVQRLTTLVLTAQNTSEEAARRSDLVMVNDELSKVLAQASEKSKLETNLAQLQDELATSKREEAVAIREQHTQRLQQATAEYRHAALQTARLYRTMLNAARTAGIAPIDAGLHIPHLVPVSWNGVLGEVMRVGTLPWEDKETRAA